MTSELKSQKSNQSSQFEKAARELECDENEEAFDAKLKGIVHSIVRTPKDTQDKE